MQTMKHLDEFITTTELGKLVEHTKRRRDYTLLVYLFFSLRRVSEVVRSLKVADVSIKSDNVRYNILKKKNPYTVWIREGPFFPGMFDNHAFIREYIEDLSLNHDDFVFPITRFAVDKMIKKAAKRADITFKTRAMHVHVLRHSGAVYYAKRCENMMDLMRLKNKLQHSSIDMTAYYLEHFK